MKNPLEVVLEDMCMDEEQLKNYILSKAQPVTDNHKVANFVEKGYGFRYASASLTGCKFCITYSNGMNVLM
jgi:hypothetical protein